MKKCILLILLFALALSSSFALSGEGTATNPYQVANINDLIYLSNSSTLWDKHFNQTANIDASSTLDLNDGTGFSPIGKLFDEIGTWLPPFTGSFNGNGYTISNLYINRPEEANIGLFARTEGANISNVGLIDNEIEADFGLGGLVASSYDTTIDNCYARGVVSGSQDNGSSTGGLVGYADNFSTINNSYATGTVIGNNLVGGLVGKSNGATISNSYATSSVSGNGATGGLVGNSNGSILNCYATGSVSGNYSVGGLVGSSNSSISNSFWDIETTGQNYSDGGTGKTTAEMQTLSTYVNAGWDFADVWTFVASDYPHLAWETVLAPDSTPARPENIKITMQSGSANITWDAVSVDINQNPIIIDHYIIYGNAQNTDNNNDFVLLGTTPNPDYTETNSGLINQYKFYRISAYVNAEPRVLSNIQSLRTQKRKVSQEEIEELIRK